jgi:hypothetical protein
MCMIKSHLLSKSVLEGQVGIEDPYEVPKSISMKNITNKATKLLKTQDMIFESQ